jgi:hypothetical protein
MTISATKKVKGGGGAGEGGCHQGGKWKGGGLQPLKMLTTKVREQILHVPHKPLQLCCGDLTDEVGKQYMKCSLRMHQLQ